MNLQINYVKYDKIKNTSIAEEDDQKQNEFLSCHSSIFHFWHAEAEFLFAEILDSEEPQFKFTIMCFLYFHFGLPR